jgi:hypothetical protein
MATERLPTRKIREILRGSDGAAETLSAAIAPDGREMGGTEMDGSLAASKGFTVARGLTLAAGTAVRAEATQAMTPNAGKPKAAPSAIMRMRERVRSRETEGLAGNGLGRDSWASPLAGLSLAARLVVGGDGLGAGSRSVLVRAGEPSGAVRIPPAPNGPTWAAA